MSRGISIRPVAAAEAEQWIALRAALWPEQPGSELADSAARFFAGGVLGLDTVLVAVDEAGTVIGFAELSTRQ